MTENDKGIEIDKELYLGTEAKLNLYIESMGGLTMDDYDFSIEAYTQWTQAPVVIRKEETIRVNEENRVVLLDTIKVGTGNLEFRVIAQIPDADLPDGYRKEVKRYKTDYIIVK